MTSRFVLKHSLLLAAASFIPLLVHATPAARVEFSSGHVVAISPQGSQRPLVRGDQLESGETIRTSENARVQLRFSDGALMSLQASTEFRIDDYQYSGKSDEQERGFFSLVKGGLRTITGAVGRSNRDNYRVSTSVATIGIRGTEYSAVFTGGNDGVLDLSTGEGRVEVCNAGGCVLVAGGQAAVVTGGQPPVLAPVKAASSTSTANSAGRSSAPVAQTPTAPSAFSPVESVDADGKAEVVASQPNPSTSAAMLSGGGYALASMASIGGALAQHQANDGEAVFGPGSVLQSYSGVDSTRSGDVAAQMTGSSASFSIDGVLGWGQWVSGSVSDYSGTNDAYDLHYVIAVPTEAPALQNLSGTTATYQLAGFTTPTSTPGAGGTVSGTLWIEFRSDYYEVRADLSVQAGALTYTFTQANGNQASGSGNSGIFQLSGTTTALFGGTAASLSANGIVAGTAASHAGIVYGIEDGGNTVVHGAAAFAR